MKTNPIHSEVKSQLAKCGFTLTEVVAAMNQTRAMNNQTTVQNVSNKLTRGTIKYSEVLEIASIIGCRIDWIEV